MPDRTTHSFLLRIPLPADILLEFSSTMRLTEVFLAKAGEYSQHALGSAGNVSAFLRRAGPVVGEHSEGTYGDARLYV